MSDMTEEQFTEMFMADQGDEAQADELQDPQDDTIEETEEGQPVDEPQNAETQGHDEEGQDESDELELPDHAPDKKKNPRAYREFKRAHEANLRLQQLERELQRERLERENERKAYEQLQEFTKHKDSKTTEQEDDALLREYGLDPDSLVDKEAAVILARKNKAQEEALKQLTQKSGQTDYNTAFSQSMAAQGSPEEAKAAVSHLVEAEARLLAADYGYDYDSLPTAQKKQVYTQTVTNLDNKAMRIYHQSNGNIMPADFFMGKARAAGYKFVDKSVNGKQNGLTNGTKSQTINAKAMQQAREQAGMPETTPTQVAPSGNNEWEAMMEQMIAEHNAKAAR